jgi:hypothetical protein
LAEILNKIDQGFPGLRLPERVLGLISLYVEVDVAATARRRNRGRLILGNCTYRQYHQDQGASHAFVQYDGRGYLPAVIFATNPE